MSSLYDPVINKFPQVFCWFLWISLKSQQADQTALSFPSFLNKPHVCHHPILATVKNYPTAKSPVCQFCECGRRYKTPRSGRTSLLTAVAFMKMPVHPCTSYPGPRTHSMMQRGPRVTSVCNWLHYKRELNSFIIYKVNLSAHCPGMECQLPKPWIS